MLTIWNAITQKTFYSFFEDIYTWSASMDIFCIDIGSIGIGTLWFRQFFDDIHFRLE